VGNEEVLHRVKEKRNSIQTVKRRKADCIAHILHRNCLVKHIVDGEIGGIEMMRRCQQNTGNLKR
jgi:hypothetical protein